MVTMYETAEAKKYKRDFAKYIKQQCGLQNYNMTSNKAQHFYCDCVFYFARMDKDPNNYFKLLLDAITESENVWIDDNVVCERVNAIYYDRNNPRIEIEIYPVEYKGIFKDKLSLQKFTHKCEKCKRYKNSKCRIMKNSIAGIVQDEILEGECSKWSSKAIS